MSDPFMHRYLVFMAWQMIWVIPLSCLIVYLTAPFHSYTLFLKRFYPEEYEEWIKSKDN